MVSLSLRLSLISAATVLLSLACQILTARTFGARHAFDIYLFAISLPFLVTGAAAGSLSQAFVPRLMAARARLAGDPRIYQDSVQGLLLIALLAGAAIALGGSFVTRWTASAVAGVFTSSDRASLISIARVAWLSAGCALFASALTAVHHAQKSFLLPAINGTSLYVGMIAAMIAGSPPRTPMVLAWGMLAGTVFSVAALLPGVMRSLAPPGFAAPQFHGLFSGTGRVALVIIANFAFSGLAPVEALLAPRFGPGALSYLGYAERLIIAMGALVVAGPNVLLVPAIAEACVARDIDRVTSLALKTIAAVIVIATLMALIFCLLRVPVITLLLQRGAFDQTTTRGVADTLPWMLGGSIAMLGTQIAFRALYGQNVHTFPAVVGVAVPGLYLIAGRILGGSLGFQGICIAYAVCWWLVFLATLVRIFGIRRIRITGITNAQLWGTPVALLVSAGSVLASRRLLLAPPQTGGNFALGLRCLAIAGLGIASFAAVGALLWPFPVIGRGRSR